MNAAGLPGAKLFTSAGCIACHSVLGKGGSVGPELSAATLKDRDKAWLTVQIRDPKSHNPNSIMPSFASLPDAQVNDLVDFLLALSGNTEKTSQSEDTGKVIKTTDSVAEKTPQLPETPAKDIASPAAGPLGKTARSCRLHHRRR